MFLLSSKCWPNSEKKIICKTYFSFFLTIVTAYFKFTLFLLIFSPETIWSSLCVKYSISRTITMVIIINLYLKFSIYTSMFSITLVNLEGKGPWYTHTFSLYHLKQYMSGIKLVSDSYSEHRLPMLNSEFNIKPILNCAESYSSSLINKRYNLKIHR